MNMTDQNDIGCFVILQKKEPSMTGWIMHDCMLSMDVLLSSHHSNDFCIQFSPNQTRPHQKAHLKPAASDRSIVESPQPPILPNPTPFCPLVLQCRGRGDRSSVDHTPSSPASGLLAAMAAS
jgi:hypothetical protein